tara:strand:+ start:167 stop:547 length:381 start_codon:yes stop_codon:yes gene_type:complete
MKTITLSPLGDLTVRPPPTLAAVADLTIAWPVDEEDRLYRSKLIRACCAALGLAIDDPRFRFPPEYVSMSMDILAYGESVLEFLLANRVELDKIPAAGHAAANWLSSWPATEAEVVQQVNFTDARA